MALYPGNVIVAETSFSYTDGVSLMSDLIDVNTILLVLVALPATLLVAANTGLLLSDIVHAYIAKRRAQRLQVATPSCHPLSDEEREQIIARKLKAGFVRHGTEGIFSKAV